MSAGTGRACEIDGCGGRVFGHGWCQKHYTRWRRHGSPHELRRRRLDGMSDRERFVARAIPDDSGCWLWDGATSGGYAIHTLDGRNVYAHRFAYEQFIGPVPAGLHIDHLCRVRNCVNPAHLEAVTVGENNRRAHAAKRAA